MTTKPQDITGYAPRQIELAEQVLLEARTRLSDFHPPLVLAAADAISAFLGLSKSAIDYSAPETHALVRRRSGRRRADSGAFSLARHLAKIHNHATLWKNGSPHRTLMNHKPDDGGECELGAIMTPIYEHIAESSHFYHVRPDEIERLVEEMEALRSPTLRVDRFPQYGGHNVFALTITGAGGDWRERKRLYVSRAHAHEPAGVAAQAELAKSLMGWREYAVHNREWRAWALDNFLITLVPDSNPCGSQRAPVKFWDGSAMPNEQFKMWMFGESGERAGERFPRVPAWDMREVAPPRLLGICYEQINEHVYVEPNRDHRSTFFRAFFDLDREFRHQCWLDLHQTEFIGSDRNAAVHLPTCHAELPEPVRSADLALGEAIHTRWRREGGTPEAHPQCGYGPNSAQHNYLTAAWRAISERLPRVVTEVQNNSPRTPPALQVHLQLTAILETMDWMSSRRFA